MGIKKKEKRGPIKAESLKGKTHKIPFAPSEVFGQKEGKRKVEFSAGGKGKGKTASGESSSSQASNFTGGGKRKSYLCTKEKEKKKNSPRSANPKFRENTFSCRKGRGEKKTIGGS